MRQLAVRCLFFNLLAIGIIPATFFCNIQTATAAEWLLEPELRLGYEIDDNATLTSIPNPEYEIQGYIVEGAAALRYATQRTTFDITPRLRSRNYFGDEDAIFDSDDYFVRINFGHKSIKSTFRIRADYGEESIRTAERAMADPDVSDPDEIPGDETGRVLSLDRREIIRVLPYWEYKFTEKSALAADAMIKDVDYEDVRFGSLVPYSDMRLRVTLSHNFSRINKAYIRASARSYEPDNTLIIAPLDVDGVALSAGIEHRFSETARIRAEIGVEESEPAGRDSDQNVIWDVNFVKNTQTMTMLAQYKRNIISSGNGFLSERDSLNLSLRRSFSERLTGGLAARAYRSEGVGGASILGERDYLQFGAQLAYALSRTLSVQADYRYTDRNRGVESGTAKSNSLFVWFIYRPNAWRASR
jgi:hypothetical protein